MADLNDLKQFAQQIAPIIQGLIKKWSAALTPPDTTAETAAIGTLQKLLAAAGQPTARTFGQIADTLAAMDTALTEVLIQAASNTSVALPPTKITVIKEQIVAINDALGQLRERSALQPLATLLPPADITTISANLQAARTGIQQKATAQAALDTIVDVVVIATDIALKVAAA